MKVLSKSRFKLGLECPNKLFFTSDKQYANQKNTDSFLQALAKGGFQVEELARLHYPNGIFINTENYEYEKAFQLTKEALLLENVVIYEAAFLVDNFFIRTDILVKKGNHIRLIEVKAKSFNPNEKNIFVGVRGGLVSSWKPYLFDLAFQKHIASLTCPNFQFEAYFMMADKTKSATIDGLNQLFRVPANGNPRTDIITKVSSIEEIGESVLSEINVDNIVNDIINDQYRYHDNLGFQEALKLLKDSYLASKYINWETKYSTCKKCEFKASIEDKQNGLLSGFEYCFKKQHNWLEDDFKKPNAMEVWNFRGKNLIETNRLFMEDLIEDDFKIEVLADKISSGERQWIQVEKARDNDNSIHVEKDGLKNEMAKWKFPLHFIDFETSTVALPFNAGRKPYESVAFQFSHHMYLEDGTIEHKSEYISNTPGEFPNFIFARSLKKALENDNGTIFKFATHENSILNAIIVQLKSSNELEKEELITFLKTITNSTKDSVEKWEGDRNMVDLNKIVKDYYYNPYTKGSNSIKAVLPASLNSSDFLKQKYSQAIGSINLTSKNFDANHIWLKIEDGKIVNPYKMLPPVFDGWIDEDLKNNISEIEEISDGGAALTGYSKLQYQDMTEKERTEITKALLKYCELDTLAMVMIYEHFKEITGENMFLF
jgi:hypothetical protein